MKAESRESVASGDEVTGQITATGRHPRAIGGNGVHFGTGRGRLWTGTSVYRLADGKIAESWAYWDASGMLRNLGVAGNAQRLGSRRQVDRD